ncbi:MAG: hypothetical protein M3X11_24805, partial [Acidobacteriota bacterium]|nr:hypothetical protein [Acidobacteriota bacterium]
QTDGSNQLVFFFSGLALNGERNCGCCHGVYLAFLSENNWLVGNECVKVDILTTNGCKGA